VLVAVAVGLQGRLPEDVLQGLPADLVPVAGLRLLQLHHGTSKPRSTRSGVYFGFVTNK
jgi:hypothetical protein